MNLLLASIDGSKMEHTHQALIHTGLLIGAFVTSAATIVSLLGILFMTIVIAPNATQRFSGALREHNIKSFFVGLVAFAGMFGMLAVTHGTPPLQALLSTLFGVAIIPAFAAGSEDIGRRLYWACGKEGTRAAHLSSGWLVFAFGSLFPVIGWFLIFPYVTLSGLGSLLVGARSPKTRPAAAPEIEFPEEK
jgi:hypothetical protein